MKILQVMRYDDDLSQYDPKCIELLSCDWMIRYLC